MNPNNSFISAALATVMLSLLTVTPVAASEVQPSNLDLFDPSTPGRTEIKGCMLKNVDAKKWLNDCDAALRSPVMEDMAVRSRFLHYRSLAKLGTRDYSGAIHDIDAAALLVEPDWALNATRCWVRAAANAELPLARELCAKAISDRGPSASVIDSFGLIAMREGKWDEAIRSYQFVKESADPLSAYGMVLAMSAFRSTTLCEEAKCQDATGKVIAEYSGLVPADALGKAKAFYAGIGIDLESVANR